MAKTGRPRKVELPSRRRRSDALAKLARIAERARRKNDLRMWAKSTAILGYVQGRSTAALAVEVGSDRSTLTRWIAAYAMRGFPSLRPGKSPGRPARLDASQMEELRRVVEAGPLAAGFDSGIWTARLVREYIRRAFGVEFSWKYVPKLLHRLGFSVQRPRKLLSRADHAAQAFWLKARLPAIKKKPVERMAS
jgi:transposase